MTKLQLLLDLGLTRKFKSTRTNLEVAVTKYDVDNNWILYMCPLFNVERTTTVHQFCKRYIPIL